MYLLAIETSCDETASAVVENGERVLSNIVVSQEKIHGPYGGIVPELACRRHIEVISPVVKRALEKAGLSIEQIDGVAVTSGPGLIGALLVGVSFAKGIAYARQVPLMAVNHLEGHLWAVALGEKIEPPFIALIVSGGHTQIYQVRSFGDYSILGGTLDDAAGEVFDKVARILRLGFPGGPAVERTAQKGDAKRFIFPKGLSGKPTLDFSFSGLKTAVLRQVREFCGPSYSASLDSEQETVLDPQLTADLAAGFQSAVVDVLVSKTIAAAEESKVPRIVVSGGVACNQALRSRMKEAAASRGMEVHVPAPVLCTDNAAMIGWVGYQHYLRKRYAPLDLNPQARLPLAME
jgi:N6-L-threonylcarbamoyladenine synthase